MAQVYDLLEDDGIFVYQVSGFRPSWQYEDLIWYVLFSHIHNLFDSFFSLLFIRNLKRGLFMNKYVFPGADASCALNWHLGKLEGVGFEAKSIDILGVHCTWFRSPSLFDP